MSKQIYSYDVIEIRTLVFFFHILLSIKKSRLRIFKIFCFALRSGSIYDEFTYQTAPSPINLYEI